MKRTAIGIIAVSLSVLGGCSIAKRAIPLAKHRSGCAADKIEVISDKDGEAVLNVCGVYEDWHFHAFDGWTYKGPSAQQPLQGPVDTDGDGIADNVDACPTVAGVATTDPKTNGCPKANDKDGDGIADAQDACPNTVGVAHTDPAKNGCPPDGDGDGIADADDACPAVAGEPNEDPAKNGCPPDKDGDGITDAQDACPDVAGIKTPDPQTNGCPDRDGDAIPDKVDACPDEKGSADPDPKKHGCIHRVVVTEAEIVINEKIQFAFGSPQIKAASNPLLDEIAKTLKDNPRIKKVEIQGHTDNVGKEKFNQRLSQKRAEAVMQALIARGVAKDRVSAKGYGMDKPLVSNETEEGQAKNRRVQFKITEQERKTRLVPAPKPAAKSAPPAKAPPAKK